MRRFVLGWKMLGHARRLEAEIVHDADDFVICCRGTAEGAACSNWCKARPSTEEAAEKLAWYTIRWQIEVFHRTLQSGCRIENRQLASAHSLKACIAVDLVVAWRIAPRGQVC